MPADPQTYTNTGTSRVSSALTGTGTYSSLLATRFNGYQPVIGSWTNVDVNSHQPVQTNADAFSTQIDWKLDGYTLTSISAYRRIPFRPAKRCRSNSLRYCPCEWRLG